MAKDKLTDYDSTASGNLDVGGISVAEGMLPSGVNNAIRELMSHQADAFGAGTPLYVDQTNNRLGVGTSSPTGRLNVVPVGNIGGSGGTMTNAALRIGTTAASSMYFDTNEIHGAETLNFFSNGTDNGVADYIRFLTGGTGGGERMRILASGGLTFNGDTAAANALDDYEEGTWTPTITGGTSNPSSAATGSGIYTKVGRVVTVQAFASSQDTTGASGNIVITGLPFTPNSSNSIAGVGAVMSDKMFGMTEAAKDDTTTICAWAEAGTTQVRFYGSRGAGQSWYVITHSAGTGRYLRFTVTYAV